MKAITRDLWRGLIDGLEQIGRTFGPLGIGALVVLVLDLYVMRFK